MNPSGKLLLALLCTSTVVLASPIWSVPYIVSVFPTVILLAVALADRLGGTITPLILHRRLRPVFSVGTENQIELTIRNTGKRQMELLISEDLPKDGLLNPATPINVTVPPWKSKVTEYFFTPKRRGKFQFSQVRVGHKSRLGFWKIRRTIDLHDEIQVYPNIEALHRFELLARHNSLAELGVKAVRMKGDGTEFERLREYRPGDEPRKVDWKTTARIGKLIVREMGQERNQNILFMIDMGRMMCQSTGGLSHFDYALNTAIILGHIAQQKGDNIGAILFSDTIHKYIPLRRGRGAVDALVHATYDIEPEQVATNYRRAFKYVSTQVRRRSLVILMSHLVPGEDRQLIRTYTQHLGQRHLPLCLFFKEPSLEAELKNRPTSPSEVFHNAAAADLLLDRLDGLSRLRHSGVMTLDALPGEYSAAAIGQYLDIKARNLL